VIHSDYPVSAIKSLSSEPEAVGSSAVAFEEKIRPARAGELLKKNL
jgi:hypothetical protein